MNLQDLELLGTIVAITSQVLAAVRELFLS